MGRPHHCLERALIDGEPTAHAVVKQLSTQALFQLNVAWRTLATAAKPFISFSL